MKPLLPVLAFAGFVVLTLSASFLFLLPFATAAVLSLLLLIAWMHALTLCLLITGKARPMAPDARLAADSRRHP